MQAPRSARSRRLRVSIDVAEGVHLGAQQAALASIVLATLAFTMWSTNVIVIKGVLWHTLVAVALALAVGLRAVRPSERWRLPRNVAVALILFCLVYLLSALANLAYPGPLLKHTVDIACGLAALVVFAWLARSLFTLRAAIALIVLTVGLVSLYAILQFAHLDPVPWKTDFPWGINLRRVTGTFGNPTYFAGFLALYLPVVLCCAAGMAPCPWRLATAIAWLCGLFALVFTFSRGGAVGFVAGMAVIVLATCRWWRADAPGLRSLWRIWPGGWTAALVLLGLLLSAGVVRYGAQMKQVVGRLFDESARGRTQVYRGTLAMIADRPLLGFGPGTYAVHFPNYWPPALSDVEPRHLRKVNHAHSELLQIAAEMGLLGLAAYLGLLIVIAGAAWCAVRVTPIDWRWWVRVGLLAGLCGAIVESLFSVSLRYGGVAAGFWTALGLLVSTLPLRTGRVVPVGLRWAAAMVAWPACVTGVLLSTSWYVADALQLRAIQALLRKDPAHTALAERVLRVDPWLTQARYQLATEDFIRGRFEESIARCHEIIARDGYFADVATLLGSAYLRAGSPEQALGELDRAVRDEPRYARGHYFRGIANLQLAERHRDPAQWPLREKYLVRAQSALSEAYHTATDSQDRAKYRTLRDQVRAALQQESAARGKP